MRTLRRIVIAIVVLGGLGVGADRLAVHLAENKAADKLKASIGSAGTPEVSIKGFPFLTQIAANDVDEIDASVSGYEATVPGGATARINDLELRLRGVEFSNGFSTAVARTATGTALIPYDQLRRAAGDNVQHAGTGGGARVTGLSDGGDGRLKVEISTTQSDGSAGETYSVLSSVQVSGDTIKVRAEKLPSEAGGVSEQDARSVTDFQQSITRLPGGIRIQRADPRQDGLHLTVGGSNVPLSG